MTKRAVPPEEIDWKDVGRVFNANPDYLRMLYATGHMTLDGMQLPKKDAQANSELRPTGSRRHEGSLPDLRQAHRNVRQQPHRHRPWHSPGPGQTVWATNCQRCGARLA